MPAPFQDHCDNTGGYCSDHTGDSPPLRGTVEIQPHPRIARPQRFEFHLFFGRRLGVPVLELGIALERATDGDNQGDDGTCDYDPDHDVWH